MSRDPATSRGGSPGSRPGGDPCSCSPVPAWSAWRFGPRRPGRSRCGRAVAAAGGAGDLGGGLGGGGGGGVPPAPAERPWRSSSWWRWRCGWRRWPGRRRRPDDFYRYSWDGRVQAAGINPYEYTPGSTPSGRPAGTVAVARGAALPARLPARRLHPDQPVVGPHDLPAGGRSVVRGHLPPDGDRAPAGSRGRWPGSSPTSRWWPCWPRRCAAGAGIPAGVALYALCPAPVLEIVNNGHVDGLAILLALAALVVASPPDRRHAGGSGHGSSRRTGTIRAVRSRTLATGRNSWPAP